MKQTILFLITAIAIYSCDNSSKSESKAGFKNCYAMRLLPDSNRAFVVAGVENIIDDSLSNAKGHVVYNRLLSVRHFMYLYDKDGKILKDSTGNELVDTENPYYVPVSEDSLLLISEIPIDSFLKKGPFYPLKKK